MARLEYKLIIDLQGSDWFLNEIKNTEEWREYALEWATTDGLDEIAVALGKLEKNKVIDFISEIWCIEFIPCRL